jgi:DNA-binding phage protein
MKQQDLIGVLRRAIKRDPRTMYAIAKDCGLRYSVVHRFTTSERTAISLVTAAKLCATLGLKLVAKGG